MLKLKLQYFGKESCLTGKDCDAGKKLKTGREGDDRGQNDWMASLTQWA